MSPLHTGQRSLGTPTAVDVRSVHDDLESALPEPYRVGVSREHELLREIAFLRDLLGKVADDIQRTGACEDDPRLKRWFQSRSRRINDLITQPVPAGWSAAAVTAAASKKRRQRLGG